MAPAVTVGVLHCEIQTTESFVKERRGALFCNGAEPVGWPMPCLRAARPPADARARARPRPRAPPANRCASRLPWLRELLAHNDGAARAAAARLTGAASAALLRQPPTAAGTAGGGAAAAGELLSSLLAAGCLSASDGGRKAAGGGGAGASAKLEEREGCILAAGD